MERRDLVMWKRVTNWKITIKSPEKLCGQDLQNLCMCSQKQKIG